MIVATLGLVLAITLLLKAWHSQQNEQQQMFDASVSKQVQAIDQQLRYFDTVISDLARVIQQTNAGPELFASLTENLNNRLKVMRFMAFYRGDDNGNLRLTDVMPKDSPELRTGSALLHILPSAGRELWADARQWRSHYLVQATDNSAPRMNVLFPVITRINQFDAAQLLGVLHMGIDLEKFVSASLHHAGRADVFVTILDADNDNRVLYNSGPDGQLYLEQKRYAHHGEFSLLTGGLNWRLHFFSLDTASGITFIKQQMGTLLAAVVSLMTLLVSFGLLTHVRRLQQQFSHAQQSFLHTRELLHQTETELDNFSYCVSHDLRAPLRHIRSYSQILLLDHGEQLAEEGKLLSQRISESGAKMSRLIDDLLRLSRVSRSPMKPTTCDLSELVSSVYVEMRQEFPQLDVRFKCEPAITVVADATLLRIALSCLMHNALKYSSKRVLADIQFGIDLNTPGEATYFIRDNGIGFDMRYVDRLFAPFNRLHGEDDFGGTGIGLATAKRVILRHGGRIWVKSVPNEGTTMFFTLPPPGSRPPSLNEKGDAKSLPLEAGQGSEDI